MARITVEDCLEQIPNRFQLVLAATYRARMLAQGHTPKNRKQKQARRDCTSRNRRWQDWSGNAEKSARLTVHCFFRTQSTAHAVLFFRP